MQQALIKNQIYNADKTPGTQHFLATDGVARFARVAKVFLEQSIPDSALELVEL